MNGPLDEFDNLIAAGKEAFYRLVFLEPIGGLHNF